MEFQFLIPIFGIICGTLLTGVIFWKIFDVIKAWINRKNPSYDEEKIDRIAKAFIQYKKETERRLQNVEAIITDDEPKSVGTSSRRKLGPSKSHGRIEIDDNEETQQENASEHPDREQNSNSGNLKNMLNQKKNN